MRHRQVYFAITRFKEVAPGVLVPLSYDYWKKLMLYFALRSTVFRVDCWSTEEKAISAVKPFASHVHMQNMEGQELVLSASKELINSLPGWTDSKSANPSDSDMVLLSGEMTNQFVDALIYDCFDRCGQVRWFSVFFMDNGKIVFSAEHYGTEFHAADVDDHDIAFIRSVLPEGAILHIFD